ERLREAAVQLAIPLHVASEPDGHARRDDFEGAAERVARVACAIDLGDHRALELLVDAPERGIVWQRAGSREVDAAAIGDGDAAQREDVARDPYARVGEKLARDRAGGHPRGGFARAGPLEDVAQGVALVL